MTTKAQFSAALTRFRDDLVESGRQWRFKVIRPYCNEYVSAYKAFMSACTAAERARQDRVELAVLALSVAGAGVMTSVFGTTVLRTLVGNGALRVICNRNLVRAFEAYAYIDRSHPWVGFVTGALLDRAQGVIEDKVRAQIRELAREKYLVSQVANRLADDPQIVQNWMMGFLEERLSAGHHITDVIADMDAPPDRKLAALSAMLQSPLYGRPGWLQTAGLRDEIELGFCMKLILERDFLCTLVRDRPGKFGVHPSVRSAVGIPQIPGQPGYPRSQAPSARWDHGSSWQEVRHRSLASGFADYVDEVHARVKKKPFFEDAWYELRPLGSAAIRKAHATLESLGQIRRLQDPSPLPSMGL